MGVSPPPEKPPPPRPPQFLEPVLDDGDRGWRGLAVGGSGRLDHQEALAVSGHIIEKSGSWFSYAGDRLGQGRENAKQFLKENPDIRQIVEDRVRKELGPVRQPEVAAV